MSMLAVRDLRVRYRRAIVALRNVSLDVPAGAVVAVLGSNGAGKTTLLRAVSGILGEYGGAVESGTITFEGRPLTARSAAAAVAAGVVQSPEGRRVFERLTVAENLRIGSFSVRDKAAKQRARELVNELFPILHERRGQRAGLLSGGQQQMLAIGRALMAGPRLLLLDEPSLGLAPKVVGQIGEAIAEINTRGTTVVLVEQNAAMALSVATEAFVLTTGEVTLSGPAPALAADDAVRDLYLGRAAEAAVDHELAATAGERPRLQRWSPILGSGR
jgi:ABC-type branched-subunit amino acid transport system ATPase component